MSNNKDYATLLYLMRSQGSKDNPVGLQIGIMTGSDTCTVGDLPLEADDLYINSKIKGDLSKEDEVAIIKIEGQDKYVILCKVVDA